jgi:hypothetical protein
MEGHGTRISCVVDRHLSNIEDITDIISARFLYDPNFIVSINGNIVDLLNCKGIHSTENIKLSNGVNLNVTIIDSTKTAMKSHQHGIAFWWVVDL